MNVEELQSVRDRERRTDKLQELRETFYADAGEFIQELREQRERAAERADDPYDAPEVKRLTDEIDTAEQTVEAIYEKRVGKIVKAASFAAADLPAGSEGMTAEEKRLFETLVEDITANREHVLDVLAGEAPDRQGQADDSEPAPTSETAAHDDPTDTQRVSGERSDAGRPPGERNHPGRPSGEPTDGARSSGKPGAESIDAAAAMGGSESVSRGHGPADDGEVRERAGTESGEPVPDGEGTGSEPDSRTGADVDRETVRITDDVGAIFGVDEREYDLSENDVVQLPAANAAPLVERDAAERL